MKTAIAEIKSRGQLTIPKKIRESSHLEEGQVVSIIPVGDSVIITPKRLELDEARRQIRRIMKASGLSEKELLKGLKEERESLYEGNLWQKKALRSSLIRTSSYRAFSPIEAPSCHSRPFVSWTVVAARFLSCAIAIRRLWRDLKLWSEGYENGLSDLLPMY